MTVEVSLGSLTNDDVAVELVLESDIALVEREAERVVKTVRRYGEAAERLLEQHR